MKILVSCANGAGTSMLMKMRVKKACEDLGIRVDTLTHCSLSEGKAAANNYDVVFCPKNFASMFKDAEKKGTKICGMKNVLSDKEAKELLLATGLVDEK